MWQSADPVLGKYLPEKSDQSYSKLLAGIPKGEIPLDARIYRQVTLNLYAYAENNPLRYIDPDGQTAYGVGLNADLFVGGGVNFGISFGFDTENFEISTKGAFGFGPGFSAGVGLEFERSPSSGEPAKNATQTSTSLEFSGNLGPLGMKTSLPVTENGQRVAKPPQNSQQATVGVMDVKVLPQLKVGASETLKFEAKKSSDLIPRIIEGVQGAIRGLIPDLHTSQ